MDSEIASMLLKNSTEQTTQVMLFTLAIVTAMKAQPGFDTATFNELMLRLAAKYTDTTHPLLNSALKAAAGESPIGTLQ